MRRVKEKLDEKAAPASVKPVLAPGNGESSFKALAAEVGAHGVSQELPVPGLQGQSENLRAKPLANDVTGKTEGNKCDPVHQEKTEHPTSSEKIISEGKAKKPERVTLFLTYLNGQEIKQTLSGRDVPDLEDWEDMADKRWLNNEKSKYGPLVLIRMEDEKGQPYLRDLTY